MNKATLSALAAGASTSNGQTAFAQVFFDRDYTLQTTTCYPGEVDSAFVVAKNFNTWMVGIEYSVQYPAGITWLGDF